MCFQADLVWARRPAFPNGSHPTDQIIGRAQSGKTHILRLLTNDLDEATDGTAYIPTIGFDCRYFDLRIFNVLVHVRLWESTVP